MKELVNFIPKTAEQCRSLLVELRDNPEGVTLADRYGKTEILDAKEIETLVGLVESQIGEKTPQKESPKPAKKKRNEDQQER